ncbi:MAG: TRAP transporter large permease subunit [bacterium]|nr:TRAP transporter large permease subunit [bacterium]MDE0287010.1 TRAP transporter large permease subunit [bacterium]MDE0437377.1 TRAP transporter large permease subunit [bacterium]
MGVEWLAIIMFAIFLVLLLVGYPVAFSFAGTAIVFGAIGILLGEFDFNRLIILFSRWFKAVDNFTLLAVPFFVFMGAILEKSGLAERMLTTIGMALGRLKGGLGLTVVVVGAMLAAATGVVAATVIVMGLLSLPTMVRYGYDHRLATGLITASGTLAQLLPPSLVLILLAQVVGVSVGDLFLGAMVPGTMLAGIYGAYCLYRAYTKEGVAPALPDEARTIRGVDLIKELLIAVVPIILLILAVLGTIFRGIATPTEAGAVGAVAAMALAAANRNLKWPVIAGASRSAANITGLVLMILFCSTFFQLIFDQLGGQRLAQEILTGLPGGFWGFVIIANIAVFLLGINLEFIEITFIAMPIFVPAVRALFETGVTPFDTLPALMIWFTVMIAINLNMAFISPPVGFSLFYLQSVKPPEVKTIDIHRGALPFMALQGVALVLVMIFPATVTWLPTVVG